MAKNMEATKKQIEQLQVQNQKASYTNDFMKEIQETIYGEIQALGDTMRHIYEELVTLHKEIVPLHDMKRKSW